MPQALHPTNNNKCPCPHIRVFTHLLTPGNPKKPGNKFKKTQHLKLGFHHGQRKAFISCVCYLGGWASVPSDPLPAGEGGRLRACPDAPRISGACTQQLHLGNKTDLIPAAHWFFDLLTFLVASIPFRVFSSMSQKTKMSQQLRAEISISCQGAVFPALSKCTPHRNAGDW